MRYLVLVTVILSTLTSLNCTLWPYGTRNGDAKFDKDTPFSGDSPKSVVFNFEDKKKILMFGERVGRLKIFENGLVSRDLSFSPALCPPFNVRSSSFLAAFWTATNIAISGTVYYRQEMRKEGGANNNMFENLVAEVRIGMGKIRSEDFFNGDLKIKDVESAIIITWEGMVRPPSDLANPSHRNTFQMVLLATTKGTYMHLVYDRLDYYQFHSTNIRCHRTAMAAITKQQSDLTGPSYHYELTEDLYLDSSNLQIYSNVINHSNAGRYITILKNVKQPNPIRLNCKVLKPDQFCLTFLPKSFCRNRRAGRYAHPSFCDAFVLCNGAILNVQQCGRFKVYNPNLQTCDWKSTYQCNDARIDQVVRLPTENWNRRSRIVSIVYDAIDHRFTIRHNNTCAGVPQGGNTVDISSCDRYLMCTNSRTFVVQCPTSHNGEKLYYNPDKNYCDYKHNVKCENGRRPGYEPDGDRFPVIITPPPIVTKSTEKTTTVTLPPGVNPCKEKDSGNVADPFSCDHYYACQSGQVAHRLKCPASRNGYSLHYDSQKNQCVYQHKSKCQELTK